MTRLESAALRLYAATKADRERSANMSRLVCEREGNVKDYDRPCREGVFIKCHPDDGVDYWEFPAGDDGHEPALWCEPCQQRQKLYDDKSVRKELGNAKRVLWAACKAKSKENQ